MSGQAAEQLTLFQEVSPASLFPWLESKKEKKTIVTYGRKCSELSENLRRVGLSVRMYLESCTLPGKQFVRTWSVKDTLSPYLILKLRLSDRRTDGNECSLLLKTPTEFDATVRSGKKNPKFGDSGSLAQEIYSGFTAHRMWPTPTQRDYKDGSAESCKNVPVNGLLGRAVHFFPTVTACEWKGRGPNSKQQGPTNTLGYTGGQLNPTWVEWLMGFPIGWTDLNPLETP